MLGLLVKYRLESDEEIADEENNILKTTTVNDKIISKSKFIFHRESNIIAYHPIKGKISNDQFKKLFCKIFERANNNVFVTAQIQTIDDESKIFESIKQFDKITTLTIELHPSNPTNRDRWKKTDEKLHDMKVEKYYEKYVSNDNINIDENGEAFGNILMAADGYGEAQIIGLKDGRAHSASTKKLQMKQSAPKDNIENALTQLQPKFKQILERFEVK